MLDSFAIDAISESSDQYMSELATHPVLHLTNDSSRSRDDVATLSTTAKAKLWKQEGLSVAEIADQLGLPVSTVQDDLGITAAATPANVATA